jgi:hypothetical protein
MALKKMTVMQTSQIIFIFDLISNVHRLGTNIITIREALTLGTDPLPPKLRSTTKPGFSQYQ